MRFASVMRLWTTTSLFTSRAVRPISLTAQSLFKRRSRASHTRDMPPWPTSERTSYLPSMTSPTSAMVTPLPR